MDLEDKTSIPRDPVDSCAQKDVETFRIGPSEPHKISKRGIDLQSGLSRISEDAVFPNDPPVFFGAAFALGNLPTDGIVLIGFLHRSAARIDRATGRLN